MQTIKISATKARNNFFELLNQVALGKHIIIERDNKEIAILSPQTNQIDWKKFKKALKESHGILKNYPLDDSPLRKKGAWKRLGRWDKNLKLD